MHSPLDKLAHTHEQPCIWAKPNGYFLGVRHDRHARRTGWVLLLCAVTMLAEIVAGLTFGSMALIADGLHMATHAGVMLIAAMAYRFARRNQQNPAFSFGTGKVGDLAGFSSALALAATAIFLAIESIHRLFNPVVISFNEAIPVAFLGLVVNFLSVWLLHDGHDHDQRNDDTAVDVDHDNHVHDVCHSNGEEHHDHNLRAAYVHILADTGLGVLAVAGLYAARELDWLWLDPLLGVAAAIVILSWAASLLRDVGSVLLDRMPDPTLGRQIKACLQSEGEMLEDFHLWRIGPGHYAVVAALSGAQYSAEHFHERLTAFPLVSHVTIEIRGAGITVQVSQTVSRR